MSATTARLDAIEAQLGPALIHAPYVVKGRCIVVQAGHHPDILPFVLAKDVAPGLAGFIAAAPDTIRELLTLAREQAAALERVEGQCSYLDTLADGDKYYAKVIRAAVHGSAPAPRPTIAALGDGDE